MEDVREAQLIMLEILKEVRRICKKHNIDYWISDGTLLGAVRHKGFIPWDDDLDISMTREDYVKFHEVAKGEIDSRFFIQTIESDKKYDIYNIPMKIRYTDSLIIEKGTEEKEFNRGIFIDVFPMDRIPKNRKIYWIQRNLTKAFICGKRPIQKYDSIKNISKNLWKIILLPIKYEYLSMLVKKTLIFNEKYYKPKYTYGIETLFTEEYQEVDIFPLSEIEFEGEMFKCPCNKEKVLKDLYGDYMKMPKEEDRRRHSYHIEIYKKLSYL